MAVTLTENAARQIKHSLSRFGGVALRLGVKKVGCNGWAYTFDIAREVGADAHVFEGHEARLVVDPEALALIDGSVLDYEKTHFKEAFVVSNPNAKSMCGCGESFNV